MKNLILLANSFPYGNWEPYLETEIKYLNEFDNVCICSLQTREEHIKSRRNIQGKNFSFCLVKYASKHTYLINAVRSLFDINFYKEIIYLIKKRKFNIRRFIQLIVFITRSHYEKKVILKNFQQKGIIEKLKKEGGVIYSYRFEYQPYVAKLLNDKLKNYIIVSRAHGYDLYEERRITNYIPLRETLINELDYLLPISDDGKKYIKNRYKIFDNKLKVFKLGTQCNYEFKFIPIGQKINIVTCSTLTKVKRIHLLIKALAMIKDIKISWTHYGEGEYFEDIKRMCENELSDNIYYNFRGYIENKYILNEYKKGDFHLFLNVSESEGIPISIMEAMSMGIPCIATDVGGNSEIVNDGYNGKLIEKDFDVSELAEIIREFYYMSEEKYYNYRKNAYDTWEKEYNADQNYKKFVNFLMKEINTKTE